MKTDTRLNLNRLLSHLRFSATGTFIVVLLAIGTSSSSLRASPAQTYNGRLTGGDFFCNGELLHPAPYLVTGTWNLSIDPATPAQLTLVVFYNGRQHLAWGNNALMPLPSQPGVYMFSAFGGIAIATLDTTVTPATFSWHVELGVSCPSQYPYSSLTFSGVANRGGE